MSQFQNSSNVSKFLFTPFFEISGGKGSDDQCGKEYAADRFHHPRMTCGGENSCYRSDGDIEKIDGHSCHDGPEGDRSCGKEHGFAADDLPHGGDGNAVNARTGNQKEESGSGGKSFEQKGYGNGDGRA